MLFVGDGEDGSADLTVIIIAVVAAVVVVAAIVVVVVLIVYIRRSRHRLVKLEDLYYQSNRTSYYCRVIILSLCYYFDTICGVSRRSVPCCIFVFFLWTVDTFN